MDKLVLVNAKIEALKNRQKILESSMIEDLSCKIAKLIVKKKAFDIDLSLLLRKIENVIDTMLKEQRL